MFRYSPQNCTMAQYFSQTFPKPGRNFFTLLCTRDWVDFFCSSQQILFLHSQFSPQYHSDLGLCRRRRLKEKTEWEEGARVRFMLSPLNFRQLTSAKNNSNGVSAFGFAAAFWVRGWNREKKLTMNRKSSVSPIPIHTHTREKYECHQSIWEAPA